MEEGSRKQLEDTTDDHRQCKERSLQPRVLENGKKQGWTIVSTIVRVE